MATVRLWVLPLDVPASVLAVLSPAERRRAERYRHPDHARRFAAGRAWLRHVLGGEVGLPAADVDLVDGPGKPRLATGPSFNLSRSGELALVAVSPVEVGVDVERLAGDSVLDAAPVACTPAERAGLDRLSAAERAEAFLSLWTAKEAYLKGRGLGLAAAPDRVELGRDAEDGSAPVRLRGEAGSTGWRVRRLSPWPGYVASVAAEGREWDLAVRHGLLPPERVCG